MATITPTRISHPFEDTVEVYKWATVTEADVCAPVVLPRHGDKTFEVKGTFGTGGTVLLEGTADPTELTPANFVQLHDPQGNNISITAKNAESVMEAVYRYAPRVSAGTGVSLTIILFAKGK